MISIEYLAGFFDGEGCLYVRSKGNGLRPIFHLRLSQSADVGMMLLRLIASQYGGGWNKKPRKVKAHYKDEYQWWITGIDAYSLASKLAPFLVIKKAAVQEALDRYKAEYAREPLPRHKSK